MSGTAIWMSHIGNAVVCDAVPRDAAVHAAIHMREVSDGAAMTDLRSVPGKVRREMPVRDVRSKMRSEMRRCMSGKMRGGEMRRGDMRGSEMWRAAAEMWSAAKMWSAADMWRAATKVRNSAAARMSTTRMSPTRMPATAGLGKRDSRQHQTDDACARRYFQRRGHPSLNGISNRAFVDFCHCRYLSGVTANATSPHCVPPPPQL
ncbi:MAG TPA: hypothetical protein VMA30_10010 [Xanthobacteraceae bacterium]|nr:hypothetical protein [Xanthobacteraceae bacterium]